MKYLLAFFHSFLQFLKLHIPKYSESRSKSCACKEDLQESNLGKIVSFLLKFDLDDIQQV
jgi:hypothetical protein